MPIKSAAAQEAVETADAHLNNAALPTYSELLAALQAFMRAPSIGSNGPGSSTIVVQEFNLRNAGTMLGRYDLTMAS